MSSNIDTKNFLETRDQVHSKLIELKSTQKSIETNEQLIEDSKRNHETALKAQEIVQAVSAWKPCSMSRMNSESTSNGSGERLKRLLCLFVMKKSFHQSILLVVVLLMLPLSLFGLLV